MPTRIIPTGKLPQFASILRTAIGDSIGVDARFLLTSQTLPCHRLRHRTSTCRRHRLPVTTIRKSPSIRKSVTRRKSISESTNESMSTSIGIESS